MDPASLAGAGTVRAAGALAPARPPAAAGGPAGGRKGARRRHHEHGERMHDGADAVRLPDAERRGAIVHHPADARPGHRSSGDDCGTPPPVPALRGADGGTSAAAVGPSSRTRPGRMDRPFGRRVADPVPVGAGWPGQQRMAQLHRVGADPLPRARAERAAHRRAGAGEPGQPGQDALPRGGQPRPAAAAAARWSTS